VRRDNSVLRENLFSPAGIAAVQQADAFKQQMLAQIDAARQAGKPVVYLSICVRPNDLVSSKAQSEAMREQLIATCDKAGVAYIDPFQAEPLPFLHDPKVDGTVIQELLMDVNAGVWPQLMNHCDVILHGPNWKYSVGASEEDLIAHRIGLPDWDGHSPVALRNTAA
ncbi:MAG: hypothetical protein ACYCW6_15205, partial [Candidatus Xenobia bacterium]